MAFLSPPALHHHHLPFPGTLCKCPSSFVRLTTRICYQATLFSLFKDLRLLRGGRVDAGKVLEEMPQREPARAKRSGDGHKGIAKSSSDYNSSSSRTAGGRTKRRVDGTVSHGEGSGGHGGKGEFGSGRSDGERIGEMGASGFCSMASVGGEGVDGSKSCGSDRSARVGTDSIGAEGVETASARKRRKQKKENSDKVLTPEHELKIGLDMCSKKGDVMGAMMFYDSAVRDGIMLEQYHYTVILYLCSSAALGVVYPGKSGSNSGGSGSGAAVSSIGPSSETASSSGSEGETETHGGPSDSLESMAGCMNGVNSGIRVSEDVQSYAFEKGFEIYERMCLEKIPLNEAALTSIARMAMAKNDGDLAFEMVKKIKDLGLTLRLRSYGPALFSFCNIGDTQKAFEVEKHMLECGIQPEEPEISALLKASIKDSDCRKVYYLLHKLRTNVRQVSPSTAELIVSWFRSSSASKVGKRKWNVQQIAQAMENGGGGWHGLGWLGKGTWSVLYTEVDVDGVCQNCGEKLVSIDIDPVETENFAKSVASIAVQRKNSSFPNFQKWLESHGPFEAVIDAANVGLFSQRQFSLKRVKDVVNGMRQKLNSTKWPLVIVHNRRLSGHKKGEPFDNKLMEKWKKEAAIYATPTGCNDDWYWLYAAVKCKSLIVTNDEMRDHNFQILGSDFFPKWKEKHQVRFDVQAGKLVFSMPPACSVVIQESQNGNWHIPISCKQECGTGRTWLCVTRSDAHVVVKQSLPSLQGNKPKRNAKVSTSSSHDDQQMWKGPDSSRNAIALGTDQRGMLKFLLPVIMMINRCGKVLTDHAMRLRLVINIYKLSVLLREHYQRILCVSLLL